MLTGWLHLLHGTERIYWPKNAQSGCTAAIKSVHYEVMLILRFHFSKINCTYDWKAMCLNFVEQFKPETVHFSMIDCTHHWKTMCLYYVDQFQQGRQFILPWITALMTEKPCHMCLYYNLNQRQCSLNHWVFLIQCRAQYYAFTMHSISAERGWTLIQTLPDSIFEC